MQFSQQSHGTEGPALCPAKVTRSALRFARKYFAALVLNARMFSGEKATKDVLVDIETSACFTRSPGKLKEVLYLDASQLQQWVRASFLHSGNAAYKAFFAAVVEPSLKVNVRSIPQNLEDIAGRFCAIIQGGEASEEDQVKLKLACVAINQGFTGHPLICGLMLQCNRMLHRQSRDIWTMAGRREICTDLEHSLIADAGQQLAMASGNRELARQFGMSSTCCRISLDEARSFSLPVPALALQWPEVLRENWEILDHRFVRPQEAPKRASDCLGVVFRPVSLQNGPTMVNKGHSWRGFVSRAIFTPRFSSTRITTK